MEKIRNIKLFKTYYKEFYVAQTKTVRDKINFVLKLVETQRIIPKKFFRSEPVDLQKGEIEWDGGNLYFDKWSFVMTCETE